MVFLRSFVRRCVISLAFTAALSATSFAFAEDGIKTRHVHGAMPIQTVAEEQPFLSENAAAMDKMMADMTVKPTGDVDRDFVAMMVPHHQGAIDMAKALLRYGHNEQLRRLAQEIVVTQQQEIAAMRLAVGEPLLPSMAPPVQSGEASP
jgi:primosomal protein N'